MEDWLLGTALGILLMTTLILLFRIELCHKSLIFALQESKNQIFTAIDGTSEVEIPPSLIEEVKDELAGVVEGMIGSMRVPTAIDHLGGVIANVIQMREQWKIQKEASQMDTMISAPQVTDDYGTS